MCRRHRTSAPDLRATRLILAVLLAEHRHRAALLGLLDGQHLDDRVGVGGEGLGVDQVLGRRLIDRSARRMAERSERRAVRHWHQRALLGDVAAEHAAERELQEVGRGVVGADALAAVVVDGEASTRSPPTAPASTSPAAWTSPAGFKFGVVDANAGAAGE
ncbi:MAG: hypothetical protein R2939_16020 [Kofleriaceae bacterium]